MVKLTDQFSPREIREKRADLLDSIETLNNLAKSENRELTDEENKQADTWFAEFEELAALLERAERFHAAKATLDSPNGGDGSQNVVRNAESSPPAKMPIAAHRIKHVPYDIARLQAFKNEDDAYISGQWLLACFANSRESRDFLKNQGIPIVKRDEYGRDIALDTQSVDDDTKGGYLVPAPLARTIIAVMEQYGVAGMLSRPQPMTSETLSIPKRAGGLTVYSPTEGSAITKSEATFGNISLTAIDRFTLTSVTRKLMRSAIVSMADQVALEIGQAFGEQKDDEWINGDGTGTYFGETGLVDALGAAGTYVPTSDETWGQFTLEDFSATAALLPGKYWNPRTAWVCSRAFYASTIEKLMLAAGGVTAAEVASGGQPRLMGYPIYFTEKMPTATAVSTTSALFGDFYNAVVIGERQGVEIALSSDRYFDTDEIAIRGKVSYDINVFNGGDGSDAGAYVGIQTAAA